MNNAAAMLSRLLSKNLHTWLGGYARHIARDVTQRTYTGTRHLLFAVCDHYEPLWREPGGAVADARVDAWAEGYPALARAFRDADGFAPRHSFFFPGEQYNPRHLDQLADLARLDLGEVELHLHHDGDTADSLRAQLLDSLDKLAAHGHLSRDADGRLRYAFIHGNWCLANARADRRWCGVDAEMPLLFDTGCYADYTFPAAPNECQPNIVNQIYWPIGDLSRNRAYEAGRRARVGERMDDRILMIQGPLAPALRPNRLAVRIENGGLDGSDPPAAARATTWVKQGIGVAGRPEWVFVKIYTHGTPEDNAAVLLGADAQRFHSHLAERYNDGECWRLHYVTAREMYNIAIAAMDGKTGNPGDYRDYVLARPPVAV